MDHETARQVPVLDQSFPTDPTGLPEATKPEIQDLADGDTLDLRVAPRSTSASAWTNCVRCCQASLRDVGATLPEPAATQARAFATGSRDLRGQRDEFSTYPVVFEQARAFTGLNGRPLAVVTATDGQQAGWTTAQVRLAALSSNSSHRLAHTTHAGLLEEPSAAQISVRAVDDVVEAVRTRSPLVTR